MTDSVGQVARGLTRSLSAWGLTRLVMALAGQLVEPVQQLFQRVPDDDGLAVLSGERACLVPNPPSPMITSGCSWRNRASLQLRIPGGKLGRQHLILRFQLRDALAQPRFRIQSVVTPPRRLAGY